MEAFIEPYTKFLLDRVPTNPKWARALSLNALSTSIGKHLIFKTRKADCPLHLFFLYCGLSGLAEKTIVMRDYTIPVLERLEKSIEGKRLLMPPEYTSEGIKTYFSYEPVADDGRVERRDCGDILYDEFSQFFIDLASKKYMRNSLITLTRLWDGRLQPRMTKKSDFESANYVYVNLAASSSNYLFKAMGPETFFSQGCGNRFLYMMSDLRDIESRIKRENADSYFLQYEIDRREAAIGEFAVLLKKYYEVSVGKTLYVTKKAAKKLVNYQFDNLNRAVKLAKEASFSLHPSYVSRLTEFAYKLCSLKCIDRKLLVQDKGYELIEIELEDVNWAINTVEEHYKEFDRLLNYCKEQRSSGRLEENFQLPYTALIKHHIIVAGGYLTRNELRHKMPQKDFDNEKYFQAVSELVQNGELIRVDMKRDPHKTGVKTCYLILIEFKDKLPEWLKKGVEEQHVKDKP